VRWLAATGVVLGLVASLWSAFIGQTIPDLLRDKNAQIADFRAHVNSVCSRGTEALSPDPITVSRQSVRRSAEGLQHVQTDLAAIDAPHAFNDEYEAFQLAVAVRHSRARSWLRHLAERQTRRRRLLTRQANIMLSYASLMALRNCVVLGATAGQAPGETEVTVPEAPGFDPFFLFGIG
jgi:hypothetical protein